MTLLTLLPSQPGLGGGLSSIMETIARVLPRFVVFVIILVVGWIIAKLVAKAVRMILHRTHFSRIADRGVVGEALKRNNHDPTYLIGQVFFYAVLLLTLQLAFGVFGPNPISSMLNAIVAWLPKAAVAILLVVIASAVAHAVRELVGAALSGLSYGRLLANIASIFIVALGIIAALNQVGIATTVTQPVLIAVLATAGAIIAIGVGGGMVRPMQQRWEGWLTKFEREAGMVGGRGAYERGREDAARGPGVPGESTAGRGREPGQP
jgi:hypothetical protein